MTAVNIDGAHTVPDQARPRQVVRRPAHPARGPARAGGLRGSRDRPRSHGAARGPQLGATTSCPVRTSRARSPSWRTTTRSTTPTPRCSTRTLNQGKQLWQGLENYILDNARTKGFRACVFTGPVARRRRPGTQARGPRAAGVLEGRRHGQRRDGQAARDGLSAEPGRPDPRPAGAAIEDRGRGGLRPGRVPDIPDRGPGPGGRRRDTTSPPTRPPTRWPRPLRGRRPWPAASRCSCPWTA